MPGEYEEYRKSMKQLTVLGSKTYDILREKRASGRMSRKLEAITRAVAHTMGALGAREQTGWETIERAPSSGDVVKVMKAACQVCRCTR